MTAMMPPRKAIGSTLVALGKENGKVVVLDADVAASTSTVEFHKVFPKRFFQMGIAEQNMLGCAAGLALTDHIPFVCTFSVFASAKPFEQIRQSIAYPNLNVKIIGTHTGFTVGIDGATHQGIEDLALMRTLPNMTVLDPADYTEVGMAIKAAAKIRGPVYIRAGRTPAPLLIPEEEFVIGQGRIMLAGTSVTLISTGTMLGTVMEAAEILIQQGISPRVLHMPSIKPLDESLIVAAAKETGRIVTIENHLVSGGLGSAVSELVTGSWPVPVIRVGIKDSFGISLPNDQLYERYEMDAKAVVAAAKSAIDT